MAPMCAFHPCDPKVPVGLTPLLLILTVPEAPRTFYCLVLKPATVEGSRMLGSIFSYSHRPSPWILSFHVLPLPQA